MKSWLLLIITFFLMCPSVSVIRDDEHKKCPSSSFGRDCRYHCHCRGDDECDHVTGQCKDTCQLGWSGNACQRRNIALNMPATIRAGVDEETGGLGVDGDERTCVSSRANRTGWWKLDLLSTHTVYRMKVVAENITSVRGWRVHVSDHDSMFWTKPCTTLRHHGSMTYLSCDVPVDGQYVGLFNLGAPVSVCEFEIYTCSNFTFGQDCIECQCSDDKEICDVIHGTCKSDCHAGWTGLSCQTACFMSYGENCVSDCGHCHGNQSCDPTTGVCPLGCEKGWIGSRCDLECPPGYYGWNCSSPCGQCLGGVVCSSKDGLCPGRCAYGWNGSKCDQACPAGLYGGNCEFICGKCKMASCDSKTGECTQGCEDGWEGRFCTYECLPGKYGPACSRECGHCVTSPCNRIDGRCNQDGCVIGFYGKQCQDACKPGFYGQDCKKRCGRCAVNPACDAYTGRCTDKCKAGWTGANCQQVCPGGTWGDNCTVECGLCYQNKDCNPETGLCDEGCFDGFSGVYCTIEQEFHDKASTLLAPFMGITVSILLSVFLFLVVCLVFKWRTEYTLEQLDQQKEAECLL
ncbi:protein draper-like [Gigantopelta aegis]|uniref:protein draper-like n=1 Tax=Gigantopelta aegis TaxID=1735272 RepID=UPI001B88A88A|nr:protein draper-like [Gigantopelta aegis]